MTTRKSIDKANNWNRWQSVNWKVVEKQVFRLQKRIYRASQNGNVKLVYSLQRLLIKSYYGKLLATRKVTQDNQGKKTAGVDGVKSLTPKQRLEIIGHLKLRGKCKPTRRVNIPKPNGETRPLGIPCMEDRIKQGLVKLALEPQWEAKFEPNSYGFRPARSCHDAIEQIFVSINKRPKFVLDADIAKCFDRIDHEKLLAKLKTYPQLRCEIKSWLKSGFMDGEQLFPTKEGTPPGGVISPLLANIALHGMEQELKKIARTWKGYRGKGEQSLSIIRYADDFVILHKDIERIIQCKETIENWLRDLGLETYKKCDSIVYRQLKRWAERRHPNKSKSWVAHKYWHRHGLRTWVFSTKEENGMRLLNHSEKEIKRHTKVKGEKSPFDGDWVYWTSRIGKHPEVSTRMATLLKKQKGKCSHCGLNLKSDDLLEIDHTIPKSKGGKDMYNNLQVLHRHCHDDKTALDGSLNRTHNKGFIGEKPCEAKVSSTVLKTSQVREDLA